MNYIDFLEKLDNNKLNNINLFLVSEPYFLDLAIQSLKIDFIGEDFLDFNYEIFDFEKLTVEDYESSIETLPLMSDKKLVIINNCDFNRDNLKKYDEILNFIMESFENFNESTYLFFIYKNDKIFKGKFIKRLEENGDIYEFSRLDGSDFRGFIKKFFLKNRIRLDNRSINFISDRLRYLDRDSTKNLYEIENELNKLANNIKSKEPTFDEIEESIIDTFEEKIFGLLDYMSEKDVKKSINAYRTMESEDKFMIYYMIIRQIRNLICVKDCIDKRINPQTAQKYCGVGNFEYNKLTRFTKRFRMEDLLMIHQLSYESEKMIKTSKRDIDELIERIIFEFCMR